MTDSHSDQEHTGASPAHAGPSFQSYMLIFFALCVFTAISFVFNFMANHGWISHMTSAMIIMLVAVVKATCVAMIFMHLKLDWGRVYCIMVPVAILAVMMVIVLLPDIVLGWHYGFSAKAEETPAAQVAPRH
jgi:caa(3)-type oxidase subunit IV